MCTDMIKRFIFTAALAFAITACATQKPSVEVMDAPPTKCEKIDLVSAVASSKKEAVGSLKTMTSEAGGNVLVLLPDSSHEIRLSHGPGGAKQTIEVSGYAYSCPST